MYVKKVIRQAVSVVPAVIGVKLQPWLVLLLALPLRTHVVRVTACYFALTLAFTFLGANYFHYSTKRKNRANYGFEVNFLFVRD